MYKNTTFELLDHHHELNQKKLILLELFMFKIETTMLKLWSILFFSCILWPFSTIGFPHGGELVSTVRPRPLPRLYIYIYMYIYIYIVRYHANNKWYLFRSSHCTTISELRRSRSHYQSSDLTVRVWTLHTILDNMLESWAGCMALLGAINHCTLSWNNCHLFL